MYNGVPGHWSAWIVNSDGNRGQWGIIPSKYKVKINLISFRIQSYKELIISLLHKTDENYDFNDCRWKKICYWSVALRRIPEVVALVGSVEVVE